MASAAMVVMVGKIMIARTMPAGQNRKAKGHGENMTQCRNEDGHADEAIDNRRDTREQFDSRLNEAAPLGRRDFRHVDGRCQTERQGNDQRQQTGDQRASQEHSSADLAAAFCRITRLPLTGKKEFRHAVAKCEKCICTFDEEKSANEKRHQCHTDAANSDERFGCFLVTVSPLDYRFDCIHIVPPVN
jgi:hypothetical protein